LMPVLGVMYLIAYIDRQNIGYAKLQMVGDQPATRSLRPELLAADRGEGIRRYQHGQRLSQHHPMDLCRVGPLVGSPPRRAHWRADLAHRPARIHRRRCFSQPA
jgi:hypothetical protein